MNTRKYPRTMAETIGRAPQETAYRNCASAIRCKELDMTAHKHAALMLQYAQDAAETDKPWERWEAAASNNKWEALHNHPGWLNAYEYRRKPRTMTYTVTIPEPLREAPELDTEYYLVSLFEPMHFEVAYWGDCHGERMLLKRGLCFKTEEDAIAAAKAMLPIKGEEV